MLITVLIALIADMIAFLAPATGQIHLGLGIALLAWFEFYLYELTRGDVEEPDLKTTQHTMTAPAIPTSRSHHHAPVMTDIPPETPTSVRDGCSRQLGVGMFWLGGAAERCPEGGHCVYKRWGVRVAPAEPCSRRRQFGTLE